MVSASFARSMRADIRVQRPFYVGASLQFTLTKEGRAQAEGRILL